MAAAPDLHAPARILVVDDEPDIAESFADLLHAFLPEASVETALTPQDALRRVADNPVDLVVTDFMMPGMNGLELLREIARVSPGVPNILVTAFGMDRLRQAGLPAADQVLHKPLDIEAFMGAVEAALGVDT